MAGGFSHDEFRAALGQGFVCVSVCETCGNQQAIPADRCFQCGSTHLAVRSHSGAGRVFSWVVCQYPFSDEMRAEVPYTVVLVELDGGGRVYGRLEPESGYDARLAAGMAVRLDPATRARGYPVFAASGGTDASRTPLEGATP